ncbi:MAG: stage II sporulation protein SpoIID, partial [Clostridia bacterium]|nr:stage II sporulation protein SpoIID [Clostridia bacterium]
DIEEAQAYDNTAINERVEQAVKETEGMVLSHYGALPYAWFHAHSGGMTAEAKVGLNYEKEEPGYTKVTAGLDSDQAPEEAREW